MGVELERIHDDPQRSVLSDHAWVHGPAKSVAQALEDEGLEVIEFARFALAE